MIYNLVKYFVQTRLRLWDIKITQTKSSLDKIFYKIVYHHIIYMCDFFSEFRRLFNRDLHEFWRSLWFALDTFTINKASEASLDLWDFIKCYSAIHLVLYLFLFFETFRKVRALNNNFRCPSLTNPFRLMAWIFAAWLFFWLNGWTPHSASMDWWTYTCHRQNLSVANHVSISEASVQRFRFENLFRASVIGRTFGDLCRRQEGLLQNGSFSVGNRLCRRAGEKSCLVALVKFLK